MARSRVPRLARSLTAVPKEAIDGLSHPVQTRCEREGFTASLVLLIGDSSPRITRLRSEQKKRKIYGAELIGQPIPKLVETVASMNSEG